MVSNRDDEDGSTPRTPPSGCTDAFGRAALLLTESLLHALAETGRLTAEEAISVAESAHEIAVELARNGAAASEGADRSVHILGRLVNSLHRDLKS